jgi:competence protein ComEA
MIGFVRASAGMDSMSTAPPPVAAAPVPPGLPTWPRPAQLATAVLLLLATALGAFQGLASWRGGSRPTELRHGPVAEAADQAEPPAAPADRGMLHPVRARTNSASSSNPEPAAPARPAAAGKGGKLTGPININRATAVELQALPGIGPKLAERIVETRAQQPFKSVDDLRRVPGIGAKTLERLRPFVTVDVPPVKVVAANADAAG